MISNEEIHALLKHQAKQLEQLQHENKMLQAENRLLREKVNLLLKRYFGGSKSEASNPNQFWLEGLSLVEQTSYTETPSDTQTKNADASHSKKSRKKKTSLLSYRKT